MSSGNSWLARQRKSDLVELAQIVQIKEYVVCHSGGAFCACVVAISFALAVCLLGFGFALRCGRARLPRSLGRVASPHLAAASHRPSTRRNTPGDANHDPTPHANACRSYEGLRKTDLELAIDEHLSEHAARYQQDPRFVDYFKSRARAGGSPVKKEVLVLAESKVSRRRVPKPADDVVAE